jgi:hypothetical protein
VGSKDKSPRKRRQKRRRAALPRPVRMGDKEWLKEQSWGKITQRGRCDMSN